MSIGHRIKERREELGMTQEELATKIGYKSRSTINKIEIGENNLRQSKIKAIAEALNTTPSYIMGWEDESKDILKVDNIFTIPESNKKVPLLGTIAAGTPILATVNIEEYFDIDDFIKADFCLRVKGDSMINADINDGDIVFIRKQPIVEDGEIAAVLINDNATLKRVYKIGDFVQLRAENPNYKPIDLNGNENVIILGKATFKISRVK